jgi:uncharacterized protein (DUF2147 family)
MFRMLLTIIAWTTASAASAAADVKGTWVVEDRSATVAITACGDALCGRIAKLLIVRKNYPQTDVNNPDPAKRNSPLLGLQILGGFSAKGDRWEQGRIYDPASGKSYRSNLKLEADGSLKVSGCVAFICRSQRWRRAR